MMIRKVSRILAACLAFSAIASSVYAEEECVPALIAIRHAEDNNPKNGGKHLLTLEGQAHAEAYSHLFRYTSSKWISNIPPFSTKNPPKKICPIKTILSSHCSGSCEDFGDGLGYSTNPYQTVLPLLKELRKIEGLSGLSIRHNRLDKYEPFDNLDTKPFTDDIDWNNYNEFLKYINVQPGQSTLIAFSKESLWETHLLQKLLNKNNWGSDKYDSYNDNVNYLNAVGSPHFNYLYVFEYPTQENTFNKVTAYMQMYHINDNNKLECIADLHTGYSKIEIAELYKIPDNGAKPYCVW